MVRRGAQGFYATSRRLLHYNTVIALLILTPMTILSGELSFLTKVTFLNQPGFWLIMVLTGMTGFLINIAAFLQIKYTTPLTSTISGTAKVRFHFVHSIMTPTSGLLPDTSCVVYLAECDHINGKF